METERDAALTPPTTSQGGEAYPPDTALVAAALHDPRGFEPLYLRYADRLFRYALSLTRSPTLADDIVSDTMIDAWRALDRFDPNRGSFASWLFTIGRRRIADQTRRDHRLWRALTRLAATPEAEDPLSAVVHADERAHLWQSLDRLPRSDREVLLLRYGAELTGREIGAVLGISDGAVRTRLHRALRRLARELGDRYANP